MPITGTYLYHRRKLNPYNNVISPSVRVFFHYIVFPEVSWSMQHAGVDSKRVSYTNDQYLKHLSFCLCPFFPFFFLSIFFFFYLFHWDFILYIFIYYFFLLCFELAATKSTPAYSSDLNFLGTIMQLSVLSSKIRDLQRVPFKLWKM